MNNRKDNDMTFDDYWYWDGYFMAFEDLPDGAWFQACQEAIGGYEELMDYFHSGMNKWDKESYKYAADRKGE